MAYVGIENLSNQGVKELLSFPSTGDGFFYGWILFAIFMVITLTSYFREVKLLGKSNFLSSLAVGSFAIIILAYFGSLAGFITNTVLIPLVAICLVIIGIWFFVGENN